MPKILSQIYWALCSIACCLKSFLKRRVTTIVQLKNLALKNSNNNWSIYQPNCSALILDHDLRIQLIMKLTAEKLEGLQRILGPIYYFSQANQIQFLWHYNWFGLSYKLMLLPPHTVCLIYCFL
jgi:hypothetical protein